MTEDCWGELDPRKMPEHFFTGAISLDYESALKADVSRQNYSVCRRYWYVTAIMVCKDCGLEFHFPADEQRYWYEELKFYVDSWPNRCKECQRKQHNSSAHGKDEGPHR